MGLISKIKKDLKKAKESCIQSWIDAEGNNLDKAHRFFEVAEQVGLVKDSKYVDGIPQGDEDLVNEFYLLEDELGYPHPQKINS